MALATSLVDYLVPEAVVSVFMSAHSYDGLAVDAIVRGNRESCSAQVVNEQMPLDFRGFQDPRVGVAVIDNPLRLAVAALPSPEVNFDGFPCATKQA